MMIAYCEKRDSFVSLTKEYRDAKYHCNENHYADEKYLDEYWWEKRTIEKLNELLVEFENIKKMFDSVPHIGRSVKATYGD